jgi:hypothetical protein
VTHTVMEALAESIGDGRRHNPRPGCCRAASACTRDFTRRPGIRSTPQVPACPTISGSRPRTASRGFPAWTLRSARRDGWDGPLAAPGSGRMPGSRQAPSLNASVRNSIETGRRVTGVTRAACHGAL